MINEVWRVGVPRSTQYDGGPMVALLSLAAVDSLSACSLFLGLRFLLREFRVGKGGSGSQALGPLQRDAHVARPHALKIGISPRRLRRLQGFV